LDSIYVFGISKCRIGHLLGSLRGYPSRAVPEQPSNTESSYRMPGTARRRFTPNGSGSWPSHRPRRPCPGSRPELPSAGEAHALMAPLGRPVGRLPSRSRKCRPLGPLEFGWVTRCPLSPAQRRAITTQNSSVRALRDPPIFSDIEHRLARPRSGRQTRIIFAAVRTPAVCYCAPSMCRYRAVEPLQQTAVRGARSGRESGPDRRGRWLGQRA